MLWKTSLRLLPCLLLLGPSQAQQPPTNLSYPNAVRAYVAGEAAPAQPPSVTGAVRLFSVAPALPNGLDLDPETGVLSGTPSSIAPLTTYTIQAANAFGSTTTAIDFAVLSPTTILDPNQGGEASELRLVDTRVGRLVDVYDQSPAGRRRLQSANCLISQGSLGAPDYQLDTDPASGVTTLTILHEAGTPEFRAAFLAIEGGSVLPVTDPDQGLPPFGLIPRNATLLLTLDDLLDTTTITPETVRIVVGLPADVPFDARVLPAPNYGDIIGGTLVPTRVLIDLAITPAEARDSAPPLPLNPLGLPPSESSSSANVVLRIPTQVAAGQPALLRNLAGQGPALTGNGPIDDNPTRDVVRGLRSGGFTANTGDPFDGFLPDDQLPGLLERQPIQVVTGARSPLESLGTHVLFFRFDVDACASLPTIGDSIRVAASDFRIVASAPPTPAGVIEVQALLLAGTPGATFSGPGAFFSRFDPVLDAGREACLVQLLPEPAEPPVDLAGVDARAIVRFTEPMQAGSLSTFENLRVRREASLDRPRDWSVGTLSAARTLQSFAYIPTLPWAHRADLVADYFLEVGGPVAALAPRDLAGNALIDAPPPVRFTIAGAEPQQANASYVLDFDSADEDGNGLPEARGQFLFDFVRQSLRARPVTRFSAVVDRTQLVPSLMTPSPVGVQTPLSPLGSRLQAIWRGVDCGFGLLDETTHNVDVEGLAWAPRGGVVQDTFAEFEISLAHSRFLPDEALNPITLFPNVPASGVVGDYAANQLSGTSDPLRVVHPRERGYVVDPASQFVSSTGTTMVPFPWNRSVPIEERTTYTWRDTALTDVGGPAGYGSPPDILFQASGAPSAPVYVTAQVPSIGLPLLMEFKCFPSEGALGLNALDASFAFNSSARPNFRAFSTGGVDASGTPVLKNPDLETRATGGFGPAGAPTLAEDNVSYLGQMDLVTRISRVHTVWIDTGFNAPRYADVVLEGDFPQGTEVTVAYRGADAVPPVGLSDASALDPYGDLRFPNAPPTFFQGDATWKDSIAELDGARYVQARISLFGNPVLSLAPALRGIGFSFEQ